ncbi:hypothetical protein ACR6C2_05055 [Streptomyces sp. INA 01156]
MAPHISWNAHPVTGVSERLISPPTREEDGTTDQVSITLPGFSPASSNSLVGDTPIRFVKFSASKAVVAPTATQTGTRTAGW